MSEQFISVDVETSGPVIGKHSLLAVGACVCADLDQKFSREVAPLSAEADPKAMEVIGKPLEHFARHGEPAGAVFAALRDWVLASAGAARPVFVGFNAAFDWGFVNWYFLTLLGENPFGIAPLDIKAYYAGFAGASWEQTRSSQIPAQFKPSQKHTHDALKDAVEQAIIFNRIRAAAEARQ